MQASPDVHSESHVLLEQFARLKSEVGALKKLNIEPTSSARYKPLSSQEKITPTPASSTTLQVPPVHFRLLQKGAEREAKLNSLREKMQVLANAQNCTPTINETSRKIVEFTRKRTDSSFSEDGLQFGGQAKRSEENAIKANTPQGQSNKPVTWKEYATKDGFLYYFNPETKETKWDKPKGVTIIPVAAPQIKTENQRYSLKAARSALATTGSRDAL